MKSHGAWLLIQQLLQATSAYLSQLKLFNVLRLHVMTRLVIMIFVITEYVSEVACCASVTPACLLSISNFLSLLCCRTDYLFCYISINVILLLKATECCIVSPQGIFFFFFFSFFLALPMCQRGCRSCVTQPATPLLPSCLLRWRSAPKPPCRHDSPVPAMSSALIHSRPSLTWFTDIREDQDTRHKPQTPSLNLFIYLFIYLLLCRVAYNWFNINC